MRERSAPIMRLLPSMGLKDAVALLSNHGMRIRATKTCCDTLQAIVKIQRLIRRRKVIVEQSSIAEGEQVTECTQEERQRPSASSDSGCTGKRNLDNRDGTAMVTTNAQDGDRQENEVAQTELKVEENKEADEDAIKKSVCPNETADHGCTGKQYLAKNEGKAIFAAEGEHQSGVR